MRLTQFELCLAIGDCNDLIAVSYRNRSGRSAYGQVCVRKVNKLCGSFSLVPFALNRLVPTCLWRIEAEL